MNERDQEHLQFKNNRIANVTEKNEQPTETTEVDANTVEAEERRALVKKLATGAFAVPVILAALSRKAAHASVT